MSKILIGADDVVGPWVCSRTGGTWVQQTGVAIGSVTRAGLVGGVVVDGYNGRSAQIHVAALPDEQWLTKAFLGFVFQYAFNQLKVSKLIGPVAASNLAARRFDEHVGFRLEATLKDACPDGDLLLYSMTAAECRWLKIRVPEESIYGRKIQGPEST